MAEIFRVTIARQYYGPDGTSGYLSVNGKVISYTLELPWKDNKNDVSCIPVGTYNGILRYDHSDGWRIELLNVPNRSHVQIHIGNTTDDSLGCILVGGKIAGSNLDEIAGGTSKPAYDALKAAFYGSNTPNTTPNKLIVVEVLNAPPAVISAQ